MSPRVRELLVRWGLVLLGVGLETLAAPPGPAPWLALAADAPFLWLLWRQGGARWKRWTFLYGFVKFAVALHWLAYAHPVHVVTAPLLLALTYLGFGFALRTAVARRAPFLLSVGVLAVLQEMAQAHVVGASGMPWPARSLALSQIPSLCAAASLLGAYGLSFVAALCSAFVSGLPALRRSNPLRPLHAARLAAAGLACAAVLGFTAFQGASQTALVDARMASGLAVRTRPLVIVQGNVPQSLKHSEEPGHEMVVLRRHADLTRQELERLHDHRVEPLAVLWPETMVPWPFLDASLARRFPDAWRNEREVVQWMRGACPPDAPAQFLVGVNYYYEGPSGPQAGLFEHDARDSLLLVDTAAADREVDPPEDAVARGWIPPWERPGARHDKRVLVPGAEYTPFADALPFLRRVKGLLSSIPELTPGEPDQVPFLLDIAPPTEVGGAARPVRAGTIVCFEIAFPGACRSWRARGATVLLNPGNYGWFGDSAMPSQVLALGRLRAAELGVGVAIAGNTGPSAIVDPAGRVTALAVADGRSQYVETVVSGPLWSDAGLATTYASVGDVPWWIAAAGLAGVALVRGRRSRGDSPTPTSGDGVTERYDGPETRS